MKGTGGVFLEKRESGVDLLRVIALLFVVTFHFYLNNGYYYEAQKGASMLLAGSIRWLSTCCVGLFLMLTGYLKSNRLGIKDCYRTLAPVLIGYLVAAAISIPVRHFIFGDQQSLRIWLKRLFGFSAVYYGWYVGMYIGLTLLSPFLNLPLRQLGEKKQLLGFLAVLLLLTALPGVTPLNVAPDFWRRMYPLTYYVLGAVIRRLQPKVRPWLALLTAVLLAVALGGVTLCSTDGKLSEAFTQEFADLWITAIAVCTFLALYRLQLPLGWQKVFRFAAGGCYGGYLLSHLFDAWCYRCFPQWQEPAQYPKLFFAVTVPIFLISLVAGKVLQRGVSISEGGIWDADAQTKAACLTNKSLSPRAFVMVDCRNG